MANMVTVSSILIFAACTNNSNVGTFNADPAVAITAPMAEAWFEAGDSVTFLALVSDDGPLENLELQWNSDVDGILSTDELADANGNIEFVTANLSPATHVITLSAIDMQAAMGEDSVVITVEVPTDSPTIEITSPIEGQPAVAEEIFEFRAVVTDPKDAPTALWVTVDSDIDGIECEGRPDAEGVFSCEAFPSTETHLITFIALDTDGNEAQEAIYMSVLPGSQMDDDGDGWTEEQGDCDDTDDDVYPGAEEFVDGLDNDCNDLIDDGTYAYDDDEDGWTEEEGDCDDDVDFTYPGAPEIPDGADNDCDGLIDEGTSAYDDDGDGYSEDDGDCDDADDDAAPGLTEVCDFVDNDCDGTVDEENASGCSNYYADNDGDGYGAGSSHCLCQASASYSVGNNSDCYDSNSAANPTTTDWYTTDRGDGSYDYNCSGADDKETTTVGGCVWDLGWDSFCDEDPAGWSGSVPACGVTADWIADCYFDWFTCSPSYTSITMACH